jgi:hypothetical protein
LKAESWITIKQVLQEVLNLSPAGREEFLETADLPFEIKEEVKSLIEISRKF